MTDFCTPQVAENQAVRISLKFISFLSRICHPELYWQLTILSSLLTHEPAGYRMRTIQRSDIKFNSVNPVTLLPLHVTP